jgi:hypothetical protein
MMCVIVLSCATYVISTDQSVRYVHKIYHTISLSILIDFVCRHEVSTCLDPVCKNGPLCPEREVCEPEPPLFFGTIEIICIAFFTFDYIIRVLIVGSVPPRYTRMFFVEIFLYPACMRCAD